MATERASLGSFLFTAPAASSRTRAPSLGWTSSTRSPAARSCQDSRCPRPAAPSTAQVRSGQATAHATSRSACAVQARTRSSPIGSPAGPIATAVCEPLCGSTPIITAAMNGPFPRRRCDRGGHALFQDLMALAPLLSPRHGKDPTGWHVVLKPGHNGRQAVRVASPIGPLNATTKAAAPTSILQ